MTDQKSEMTFEEGLAALQKKVRELETGELSLEQGLKAFEEGVSLSRKIQEQVTQAEKRIEILIQSGTATTEAPKTEKFNPEDSR